MAKYSPLHALSLQPKLWVMMSLSRKRRKCRSLEVKNDQKWNRKQSTLNTVFAWSENSPPPVLTRSRAQHTSKNLIYVSLQKCGHKSPQLWTVIGQSGSHDRECRALIGPRIRKCKYWIKLFDFPSLCPPRPCLLQVTTNKVWQYLKSSIEHFEYVILCVCTDMWFYLIHLPDLTNFDLCAIISFNLVPHVACGLQMNSWCILLS